MSRPKRIGFLAVPFAALLIALSIAFTAYAQQASRGLSVIRERIDESRLVTLYHNTRPEATAANDRGIVPDDFAIDHMQLQLKRSPEREAAMKQYIEELHQSTSPNYHKWLTAAEFGRRFGLAQEDINAVSAWLGSHGFTVREAQPSGLAIDFSGTAGMVRQAYHTEIHKLEVNSAMHIANMSDPKIPAALEPAVAGVVSLHNFVPRRMSVRRTNVPVVKPGDTLTSSQRALAAQDIATIYNLTPLFNAGISGKGQTVMVLEDTDVYDTGDWTIFRKTFGLARPFPSGSFVQVHPSGAAACSDPGVNSNGDDGEAILDAEWASAGAPNAAIVLASCANTTGDGILIALLNVLNGLAANLPSVISISYGQSESENGAAANLAYNNAYALGVSEGVSIFVSSGDQGAASSDAGATFADHGITVSGLTSTPYNVSVGGTDFGYTADNVTASTYWNSTNNNVYASALSYIQEIPWNDSCASAKLASFYHTFVNASDPSDPQAFCNSTDGGHFIDTIAGSGGPSGCATGAAATGGVVSGTCHGYAKPAFQMGLFGNPSDGVRDIPDVSLFAANGFWDVFYIVCYSDPNFGGVPCTGGPSTWSGFGGTSVSSPIMAGIQALVNQRTGSRWGNPNVNYYRLAGLEYGTGAGAAACKSTTVNKTSNTCIFYDVTEGDMDLPCRAPSGTLHNCYLPSGTNGVLSTSNASELPAYGTSPGWDFSTGIGTVNAYNLVMATWM